MTVHDRPDRVDRLVERVLDDESRTRAPDRMVEAVFAAARTTRQARRRPWDGLGAPRARGLSVMALAAGALLAGAGLMALAGGGRPAPAPPAPAPTPSLALSALCANGGGLAGGGDTLWVRCPAGIRRIDLAGPRAAAGPLLDGVGLPVLVGDELWAPAQGTLVQLDPATGNRMRSLPIAGVSLLAGSADALWAMAGGRLARIDPATGAVTESAGSIATPMALVVAGGAPWVASSDGHVYRMDPGTLTITARIPVGDAPGAMTADDRAVYVVSQGASGTVTRIDLATDAATQQVLALPTDPGSLGQAVVGASGLFVSRRSDLVRLDPISLAPGSVTPLPAYPSGLLLDGTTIWAFGGGGRLDRLPVAPGASAAPPS